jgi:hypothetical protein
MNSKQPGRASRIRIDREDAQSSEVWVRGKDNDQLWCDEMFRRRGSMPSHELLKRIRDAIGVEDVS